MTPDECAAMLLKHADPAARLRIAMMCAAAEEAALRLASTRALEWDGCHVEGDAAVLTRDGVRVMTVPLELWEKIRTEKS